MFKTSDLYYSDEIEETISFDPASTNGLIDQSLLEWNKFITSLLDKATEWQNEGAANIMTKFEVDGDNIRCLLTASMPWTQERVEEFHQQVKEGKAKDDQEAFELLRTLVKQFPETTVEFLKEIEAK